MKIPVLWTLCSLYKNVHIPQPLWDIAYYDWI